MGKRIDLTNQRYRRFTVTRPGPDYVSPSGRRKTRWWCRCDCGNEVLVMTEHLRSGHTKSCGCLQKERASETKTKHGLHKHPLYHTWNSMMQRCYNPNHPYYARYGGRGIEVCKPWHDVSIYIRDIETFLGPRPPGRYDSGYPKYTVDRVLNGCDYHPFNVRWNDAEGQVNNRG